MLMSGEEVRSQAAKASGEQDFVIAARLSQVGLKSYLAVIGIGIGLFVATVVPLWASFHLNIKFNPIIGDDAGMTSRNQSVNVFVLKNDADPIGEVDPSTVKIERAPRHGTATPSPETGIVTYTPEHDFAGGDMFMYSVQNRSGGKSGFGVVKVAVAP